MGSVLAPRPAFRLCGLRSQNRAAARIPAASTAASGDSSDDDSYGTDDTLPGELHYMLLQQGLDPEATPSLAIVGARASPEPPLSARLRTPLRAHALLLRSRPCCTDANARQPMPTGAPWPPRRCMRSSASAAARRRPLFN